jgi:hypothetical protein
MAIVKGTDTGAPLTLAITDIETRRHYRQVRT